MSVAKHAEKYLNIFFFSTKFNEGVEIFYILNRDLEQGKNSN